MPHRFRVHRVTLAAGLLAAPGLAGCGGDGAASSGSTTSFPISSEKVVVTDPNASPIPSSPPPKPTIAFDEGIDEIERAVDAAGTDPCKLIDALSASNVGDPTTPDQVRRALEVTRSLFLAIATSLDKDKPDDAAAIRAGTDRFTEAVEQSDYAAGSMDQMGDDAAMQRALGSFQTTTKEECP